MKYPIFAIRDDLDAFAPQLMIQVNEQTAARGFAFLVSNQKTEMGFAPSNYNLYKVGEFDCESGMIISDVPIKFICNGGSMSEKPEGESQ